MTSMMMRMLMMIIKSQPKSMQHKVAFLIIIFAANVAGIRNDGGSGSSDAVGFTASSSFSRGNEVDAQYNYIGSTPTTPNNFYPSEALTRLPDTLMAVYTKADARISHGGFRPSQMFDFTPSDATSSALNKYPPSYIEPNYSHQFKKQSPSSSSSSSVTMDKQFSFPNEQTAAAAPTTTTSATKYYFNNYQPQSAASTEVPIHLHTTPIVSYLDPYTNANYHYTPVRPTSIGGSGNNYNFDNYQDGAQAYTVQSSMLVGQHQRPTTGAGIDAYEQRPGYVFDESPRPSPIYTHNQQRPQQFNYNHREWPARPALRPGLSSSGSRPLSSPPTTTSTSTSLDGPSRKQEISYDSHDYPPPSYFQQQTSNYLQQSSQRQDIANYQVNTTPFPPRFPPSQSSSPSSQPLAPYKPLASSIYESSYSSPNYANNFGNYLQGGQQNPYQQQQPSSLAGNYKRPPPQTSLLSRPPSQPASYNDDFEYKPIDGRPPPSNYYEYQLGEIPPPNYRPPHRPSYEQPPRPPPSPTQTTSSLASLASLLTSTQQYAPQFTNLLLGGDAGNDDANSPANSPLGSLLGAFTGTTNTHYGGNSGGATRPLNMQLIRALENIARNDDLQCVPKVLCQMIAGQTQRGQLPGFITSPAITNFLAGFPASSPALIYGRAALLGISGGERSCSQTYVKCPKSEYEILHYLNNHRGGFFKFFSEPDEQTAAQQLTAGNGGSAGPGGVGGGGPSLFSILSALTGSPVPTITTTTPRPTPRPTAATASVDVTSGIGNFFTQVLSDYLSGVEYQRRRRRTRRSVHNYPREIRAKIEQEMGREKSIMLSEDFHDEEDEEDTRNGIKFQDDGDNDFENTDDYGEQENTNANVNLKSRILFKDLDAAETLKFFPESESNDQEVDDIQQIISTFNRFEAKRKLKFPSESTVREYRDVNSDRLRKGARRPKLIKFTDDDAGMVTNQDIKPVLNKQAKQIVFKDTAEDQDSASTIQKQSIQALDNPSQQSSRVIFPDRYERHIRKGRILNRPTYASTYENYVRDDRSNDQDKFVVSDSHRTSHHQDVSVSSASNNYNPGYYTQTHFSNSNLNSNYNVDANETYQPGSASSIFRPTNKPNEGSSYGSNYNYPNTNYISNNRYSSYYQGTRSPSYAKHEDDKNIYVNNAHGVTEFYIAPNGRKIYI